MNSLLYFVFTGMATSWNLEDHITCAVCIEVYTNPYVLKCIHTFCYECIQRLNNNGRVECPKCRDITNFSEIKKNFDIESLIESYNKQLTPLSSQPIFLMTCDVCKNTKKKVTNRCQNCEEYMCKDCETAHKGSKATRNHQIKSVKDILKSRQNNLKDNIKFLERELSFLENKCVTLKEQVKTLGECERNQITEVDKHIDRLIKELETHRHLLKKAIHDKNHCLVDKVTTSQQLYEDGIKEIKSKIELVNDLLKTEDTSTLLETTEAIDSNIRADVEKIKAQLPKTQSTITSPIEVMTGDVFNPETYVSLLQVDIPDSNYSGSSSYSVEIPDSYFSLVQSRYKEIKEITYDYRYFIQGMCMINNDIWCTIVDAIHIYSKDCVKLRKITHEKLNSITRISYTDKGHVIVACYNYNGLHQLDNTGTYKEQIHHGNFSDVCYYNQRVYALEYKKCSVIVFHYNHSVNKWEKFEEINLNYYNSHCWDRMCIDRTNIYVSSWNNDCLYKYNHNGKLLLKTGENGTGSAGMLYYPMISGIDSSGNVLIADEYNNRLQLYNTTDNQWCVITLPGGLCGPMCALMDTQCQDIWVATSDNKIHKYQKL